MPTIENLLNRRTDLSTFLVHLTRDTQTPSATARDNLLSILWSQRLEARSTYGMAITLEAADLTGVEAAAVGAAVADRACHPHQRLLFDARVRVRANDARDAAHG